MPHIDPEAIATHIFDRASSGSIKTTGRQSLHMRYEGMPALIAAIREALPQPAATPPAVPSGQVETRVPISTGGGPRAYRVTVVAQPGTVEAVEFTSDVVARSVSGALFKTWTGYRAGDES